MNKQIDKPWGSEEIIEINEKYMVKKLFMKKNHRSSLQYYEFKKETIYILSGKLLVIYGNRKNSLKKILLSPNQTITLNPFEIHRMEGVEDTLYLESSTPEMQDVKRIEDDYNRS